MPSETSAKVHKRLPVLFELGLALFILISFNQAFFHQLIEIYPLQDNLLFILSVGILLTFILLCLLQLLSWLLSPRYGYYVLLLLSAMMAYFTDQLGILFDRSMITNIAETNAMEATELFSSALLLHLTIWAGMPVAILWWWSKKGSLRNPAIAPRMGMLAAVLILTVTGLFAFSDQYASFFREHKSVRYYTTPVYGIYSALDVLARAFTRKYSGEFQVVVTNVSADVQPGHVELVILVLGETARADHFSLNGYQRDTNPRLQQYENLLSYRNMTSCGTSTAVSVPCLFSFSVKSDFDADNARHTENVLDVLQKAGVNVLWRDNNSDSKGVADRVTYEDFTRPDNNPVCDVECRDEGMLSGLQNFIDQQQGDILIVLHQRGSHGPAYYKRYPKEFEIFTPACHTGELAQCSHQEVVNAYDNSILYTDFFLSQVIDLLKHNTPRFETSMLYMSDHGESLGENGLYLHGLPYFLAPDAQTHVPFIAWAGVTSDIEPGASAGLTNAAFSHDEFSCSLLHTFEINAHMMIEKSCHPYFVYKPE